MARLTAARRLTFVLLQAGELSHIRVAPCYITMALCDLAIPKKKVYAMRPSISLRFLTWCCVTFPDSLALDAQLADVDSRQLANTAIRLSNALIYTSFSIFPNPIFNNGVF